MSMRWHAFESRRTHKPGAYPLLAGTPSITPGIGLYTSSDQFLPEEAFRISESLAGSRPEFAPIARASHVPIMCTASSMLLHAFATCPLPAGPAWKHFSAGPMPARIGRARSKAASSPPHMKARLPALATAVPPDTGVSR